MDDPPDDTYGSTSVTITDATTMSCSVDEINKKKSSQPPSLNDVPSLSRLSNIGPIQPSPATLSDTINVRHLRIEASPSAGSVLHPVSFGKILQSVHVKDIVNSRVYGQLLKIWRLDYETMVNGSTVWKPSQTLVLTYDKQMLPQRVLLCYNALSVKVIHLPDDSVIQLLPIWAY
ncbi:hypothetical protein EVAR_13215_1 [Eumeta japonica]|uniref:Uncharacterized protein n=1 Tax=Eumeta variegata TaxID=151549 RepID=A0A4C1TS48_EUMVA|nr:hypothetical protein EVAR_13215_1 [Eumeta japonica]